jgi:hypothetical protein
LSTQFLHKLLNEFCKLFLASLEKLLYLPISSSNPLATICELWGGGFLCSFIYFYFIYVLPSGVFQSLRKYFPQFPTINMQMYLQKLALKKKTRCATTFIPFLMLFHRLSRRNDKTVIRNWRFVCRVNWPHKVIV